MTGDELGTLLVAAYEGDPDDLAEAFADDGWLRDDPREPAVVGPDEVLAHLLAYGGRRETVHLHDAFVVGDRGGAAWTVWFRGDSAAFAQHCRALLTLDDDGAITTWDGVFTQVETEDLSAWGGD